MAKKNQKNPDQGLENVEGALNTTENFIEKYQDIISWVLLAIILVIMGIFALNKYYLKPRAEEASFELSRAEVYFAEQNYQVALDGDGDQCIGFSGVIEEYGSTDAGHVANLYAAICQINLGNMEDALDYLKKFKSDNDLLNLQATVLKGDVQVELGNVDDAIKLYNSVAKAKNDVFSPRALKKAGIAYESLGEKELALKAYQQIKDDYTTSEEARDIDKYISKVK